MGLRHFASEVSSDAGFHALHVRRGSPNLQHGNCIHAPPVAIQECCSDQHRYAHLCVLLLRLLIHTPLAFRTIAFAQFAPGTAPSNAKSLTTLPLQKLVYIACNVLTLALGLWKCRSMGLLPTGTADWLAFESRGTAPEMMLL